MIMAFPDTIHRQRQARSDSDLAIAGIASSIMVVDDDTLLLTRLKVALEKAGFLCFTAENSEQMNAVLSVREIDAILLDVGLPDEDGFAAMHRLRQERSDVAILMLTGRSEIEDRLAGLEGGADDYITKPFDTREMIARVRAVLRRKQDTPFALGEPLPASLGGWSFDIASRKLIGQEGGEIKLSCKEFDLLLTFARNPGKILSRDWLQYAVNHRAWNPTDRSIDILVGRLRKKLQRAPALRDSLVSERMLGYRLIAKVSYD